MGALKQVFASLSEAHAALASGLESFGHSFAHSRRLGFLGTSPANVGTCLAVSATIQVKRLSATKEFRQLCELLGVQVRMGSSVRSKRPEGVVDISNKDVLGSSEVDKVNQVIRSCQQLLAFETRLENGEEPDLL